ncbi:unnamed protein product [Prunus armeniaca]
MARREECRYAIKYYACRCARILRFVKNEPNRVRLVCDGNNEGDKAKRFDKDLRTNPNMSVADFMSLVRKHYGIDVTMDQCYKAKNLANERIHGSIEEQYAKLWDYYEELKRKNPRSTVLVKTSLRGDDLVF